jgi:hypothetical protein
MISNKDNARRKFAHFMKEWENAGKTSHVLKLCNNLSMVSFTLQPLYPRYPFGGPGGSLNVAAETKIQPLSRIEPQFSAHNQSLY